MLDIGLGLGFIGLGWGVGVSLIIITFGKLTEANRDKILDMIREDL